MEPMKLYEQWLRDYADDAETVQDLLSIKDDPKEIEDRFYRELEFGTAGMRGVLGAGTNRLNKYNVRRVSRALAKYILTTPDGAQRGVAIAYDSRRKSPEFAKEAALVLCAAGVRVFLYESLRPVPVLSFTIRHLNCIAGIVITASHNPKQYNGYKAYWTDGGQMPPESVKGITDRLPETTDAESLPMDEQEALDKGLLTYIGKDVDDAYIAAVKKLSVNPELAKEMGKTLKIVYTPLHGSGNLPVRRIFKEIGMENVYVVKEQELPDGEFPTVVVPNPEDPRAFELALKMQKELGADLCVGTDPDCDRVGIACMTENGLRLLNGNQIGCILLHYILSQKKQRGELPANAAAVTTIVSTEMARAIAEDYGVKLIKVLTGFKYIAEQIHLFETTGCNTFVFGFEESYGFLSGTDVRDKDGVNACMLIAEAASWYKKMYNKTLADAIDMLYEKYGYYGDKVTSFVLPGKDGLEKMGRTMSALRDNPPKDFAGEKVVAVRDYQTSVRTTVDGQTEALTLPKSNVLYFELENKAWICVRPSGTEPKIKLYVNAVSDSDAKTRELLNAYSDAAVKLLESL
ncbi:MAG: phospho-sugar mutase [Clostridia bacterium]|nr:phospho-sugar mutase [Clostridia bacterium]